MNRYIDTHTHIYLDEFQNDIGDVVQYALSEGVEKMLMPNVDLTTLESLKKVAEKFPAICLPMMGLHPTSVKQDFEQHLSQIEPLFNQYNPVAIGETGIDLYWDKTWYTEQVQSFQRHINWALEYDLPLVVHSRKSVQEIKKILEPFRNQGLKGIMHCFPGNIKEALWYTEFGLHLGIGGVVTYKNSEMAEVVREIDLKHIVLETDAPYLPPVPYRGKRNQPAYLPVIAEKIAEIKNVDISFVSEITTANAVELFQLKEQN